jgi:hypothetical protein
MAKGMLKNQSHKQKACACGRGTIYTGDNAKYNQKIDGESVCEHCYVDFLINKFHNKES